MVCRVFKIKYIFTWCKDVGKARHSFENKSILKEEIWARVEFSQMLCTILKGTINRKLDNK